MRGLLNWLRRTAAPLPPIGYLFRVRANYTPTSGMKMTIAVQDLDADQARVLAVSFPDVADGVDVVIETARAADARDFPNPDAYVQQVGRVTHFGAQHRHHQDWREL